jgi:serine/threonine-protein kinase
MSYCLNPSCHHPENSDSSQKCRSCGLALTKLHNRYRVMQALAQGGFGATFLAKDESLPGQPICVIKQLRLATNTPEVMAMARELFAREASTLGRIGNHPQVPRLLDYFDDDQQFYLVQEFVNGWTIQQEIKRNGPMSEAGVKQFLSEMLGILQYIHNQQVIHRDIKPNNLIRRAEDGRLVLIDFGAVKNQVSQTFAGQNEQTALTAFAIGTAGFAPPEQIAMRPVYASDIYAVGITCLYLLTGKSPKDFDYHPSTGEMLWEREVHLSQHMTSVLKKMLEASVRHRYQSASDVLKALELEPYLDSIAKGMATQPATRNNSLRQTQERSNSYTPPSVASSAAAIRARRDKPASVNVNPALTRQQVATSKMNNVAAKSYNPGGSKVKNESRLDTASFVAAYLKGIRDFIGKDLSSLNLQGKNLVGINFHSAKLNHTNFQGANLSNSDLGQASLNGVNLRDAKLSNAYLSHADLSGADMRGADLCQAYLHNANLRGANLCGANLLGAKITDEQLALAKTNWMTIRPYGKRG